MSFTYIWKYTTRTMVHFHCSLKNPHSTLQSISNPFPNPWYPWYYFCLPEWCINGMIQNLLYISRLFYFTLYFWVWSLSLYYPKSCYHWIICNCEAIPAILYHWISWWVFVLFSIYVNFEYNCYKHFCIWFWMDLCFHFSAVNDYNWECWIKR